MTLTHRQAELLDYIEHYVSARGIAPTLEEMRAHLGLSNKGAAHRLLGCLEERGRLRRLRGRTRALEIVDQVPSASGRSISDRIRKLGLHLPCR